MADLKTPARTDGNELVNELRGELITMASQLKMLLPKEITPEVFSRVVVTAVQREPELLIADRKSLFDSCLECAKEGLLPDGKEAALVVFNKNIAKKGQPDNWIKKISYMPMVKGIIKRLYEYGDCIKVSANCVYENDEFDFELGDNEGITHRPTLSDRGNQIAVYAILKLKNGEIIREVMGIEEIEKHRQAGKAKEAGYWKDWFDEMSKKTVIRKAAKKLRISIDYDNDGESVENLNPQLEVKNTPKLIAPETTAQIEAPKEDIPTAEVVNPETGEITELPKTEMPKRKDIF